MKLTEKEKKRFGELIDKALGKETLNEAEMKELKAMLKKLEDKSENEKYSMDDKFDIAFEVVQARNALEFAEKKALEALPLKEKLKRLKEQMEEGIAFAEKHTERLTKENEEAKFEREYAEHVKKYGNSLPKRGEKL